jgi:hypothetical protein
VSEGSAGRNQDLIERGQNMNYSDFKKEFSAALKKYPDASGLYSETARNDIEMVFTHYEKRSGRWEAVETNSKMVDFVHYLRVVSPETVKWFRNLGGYEKIVTGYTRKGFLPVESISISPLRDEKSVRGFIF